MKIREALEVVGSLGYPSKMPGTSYGISAHACVTGSKLAKIPGSVCFGCYALKANYQYPSVAIAHAKRLEGISNPLWTAAMVTLLLSTHKRGRGRKGKISRGWHRWFDSGDLQSVAHLTKIAAVAAMTPGIRHWLPTRELGIVKAYRKAGGVVPANLVIRISATMVDGDATQAWPVTSGVHTNAPWFSPLGDDKPGETHVCPAPRQDGRCGDCRACWDPAVEHVSYLLH